ncbi:hypothetical protein [Mycolicibacterium peregrinum]|uniref:Minor tail protein n=1 Tax=Mycolicibacterium peregrinum TaxID=43304 RepID=A0A4Z0HHX4_MYCPR|nr:hypothetical protein [Mycolicibacterium peregrinum]TGB37866.1 hypothetical protein EJD98_25280 [Mycolicibacterium peregrinum]TGB38115.1 hypothetical protein EJD94_25285 [Mycolicibacterium peregrinum]
MTAGFGGSGYTNPQTRALNSIANGGPADTSSQEAMVELLQKHSAQLKYLASNQKQMQQGINDATANPIQQLQQFVADIIVLLGGGELAKGALDFGDLQYVLPALGALFGFGDGPFPISLFEAASKFFLGYVVPQEQFVDVINNIITAWAGVFGIDPEFIADVRALVAAVGNLFGGIGNLFPSLNELFEALGITPADLGPLGQILAPIIQLFAGIDLTKFGDFIEFITDAISPFIEQLTALINFINGMLAVLGYDGGDVVNSPIELLLRPFQNLIKFLADLNLFDPDFNLGDAAASFINLILGPTGLLATLVGGLLDGSWIPGLDASKIISGLFPISRIGDLQDTLDAMDDAIASIPGAQGLIDKICNALGVAGTGHTVTDVYNALFAIPGSNIGSPIGAGNVPGIDASKIISGTIAQTFLNITNIAAGIISGTLSGANIPTIDASKIGSGTLLSSLFPDLTIGMSTDMQSIVDGLLNGSNNTPGASGQSLTSLESTWAALQTGWYNVLGGHNVDRASQQEALDTLTTIKDTIVQQGNAISTIQGMLEGADGFSAVVPFRQPETTPYTMAGGFTYVPPSWFNTLTDFIDVILIGGGSGGGGGLSDSSQAGADSWFKANGVTKVTGAGGASVGPGPGGGIGASPGNQNYLDILYQGGIGGQNTKPGTQPGGGGGGGNFFGVIGNGGNCGVWGATTLGPGTATAPLTGYVGPYGAGTSGGFGAREGGDGKVWVRARAAMPSSFTSVGNIPSLAGGAGALNIPMFRLNTGIALTNEVTAAASWSRVPPLGSTGGHVIAIRANSGFTYFVYLRVWYTGGTTNYEIGRVVSGVRAPWKAATIASAIPFNAFSLSADSQRVFTVNINGVPFDSYSDNVAASSSMGPGYMAAGWGSSDSALPGSIQQFAFLDSGVPSRITSSTIATQVATNSASYVDLTGSVGPSVSLVVPPSGEVVIDVSCDMATTAITNQKGFMGVALSGANTVAAADTSAASGAWAGNAGLGGTLSIRLHFTGLTPGTTTFTSKYKSSSGNINFSNRRMIGEPKP